MNNAGYIPGYISEARNEKINNVNSSLIENLQELIQGNQNVDIDGIEKESKGKEIKYDIKYHYTVKDLLIQTREDFLSNKFIPLKERVKLVEKIDSLIFLADIAKGVELSVAKKTDFYQTILALLFAVL